MLQKVSVYLKSRYTSPSCYYRITQYLSNIKDIDIDWNNQLTETEFIRWVPFNRQCLIIKIYAFLLMYIRVLFGLIRDVIKRPDVIVVSRRFLTPYMPISYKLCIAYLVKKKTKIVWDYDDNIIGNELSKRDFKFLSRKSTHIVVTHDYLKQLISEPYEDKVILLPTTDGDLYRYHTNQLTIKRLSTLEKEVRLTWVATASNLIYLKNIIPYLEDAAMVIMNETQKSLKLTVVCNIALEVDTTFLSIQNIQWSRESAIESMKQAHIGIMPLADNEYTKGKGGFKIIQYMSIGLPVIASSTGFNRIILQKEEGGILIHNNEWSIAISKIIQSPESWLKYSENAKKEWEQHFAYDLNYRVWNSLISNQ